MSLEPPRIAELEDRVEHALRTGDESGLDVIAYGEVSCVLRWPAGADAHACKRLPRFADPLAFDAYRALFERYHADLRDAGVHTLASDLVTLAHDDGSVTAYCVQPLLDPDQLGPGLLRRLRPDEGHPLLDAVADAVATAVTPELGIDGQLSNWAWIEDRAVLVDVTTPFLRADGRHLLDFDQFLVAAPWVLRPLMRRWVLPSVLAKYHETRAILVDLAGNLVKERLEAWLPAAVAAANAHVTPAITEEEALRYYASDKQVWATMQVVVRANRAWQTRIRRRPYPVLLPGPIER
ncbi:MAG: DUF6206 family protein [Acidimicrobiales bacterium]|nr:DUF6206 family protein [Acidimicrobiales bacterium]